MRQNCPRGIIPIFDTAWQSLHPADTLEILEPKKVFKQCNDAVASIRKPLRGLLRGSIRVVTHRFGSTVEGQPEFPGNLRPEFAEHVETHVLKDVVAHPLRWSESSLVRMEL
jgi:hypothetical protein